MTEDKYNGWTNRETWATHLHITNVEYTYNVARRMSKQFEKAWEFGDALKQQFEEMEANLIEGTLNRDGRLMLTDIGSLWRVNWQEIAEALMEENDENGSTKDE